MVTAGRDELAAFLRQHTAALAARDVAAISADYTADAVIVSPMFATLQGRPSIEASYRALFTAFPDWNMKFDATIVDPPHAVMFATAHGTHEADFFGIPGTHRRVDVHLASHVTFADGLIAHERRIYDFTGLLLQVGVLRAKPAKP